jgi:uncharacterized protein YukE
MVENRIEVQPSMMAVHSSATAAAQSHHEAMLQDTRVQMMKLW